jgi:RNA polymerase sigma-70 factor (ECF subfamily)
VTDLRVAADSGVGDAPVSAEDLLTRTARGDEQAFAQFYDRLSPIVFGVIRRVLRDPAQSEEVMQEVLFEIWRTAARYDRTRASAQTWALTIAHRRAVDRVRSEQAASNREVRVGQAAGDSSHDVVVEEVVGRLEQERVRRCLGSLTELQREAISLAYYSGYTYREVAELLTIPLPTIKTRMRDGLIRLRDCVGAS